MGFGGEGLGVKAQILAGWVYGLGRGGVWVFGLMVQGVGLGFKAQMSTFRLCPQRNAANNPESQESQRAARSPWWIRGFSQHCPFRNTPI